MGDFDIWPSAAYPVADTLAYVADLIAQAGRSITGIGAVVPLAPVGQSLCFVLEDVDDAWTGVVVDLAEGLTQLATLVSLTVACYLSVDEEQDYRFTPVLHHG